MVEAELIILQTVSRGDMHETSASRVINEAVSGKELPGALAKRVLLLQLPQVSPIQAADDLVAFPCAFLGDGRQQ